MTKQQQNKCKINKRLWQKCHSEDPSIAEFYGLESHHECEIHHLESTMLNLCSEWQFCNSLLTFIN